MIWLAQDVAAQPVPSAEPTPPAATSPSPVQATPAPETEDATDDASSEGEVIMMQERWPGVDLVDAEHTSRATSVIHPEGTRTTATLGDHLVGAAGVAVQRTGPGQGVPIVRGMIGSAVLVLVDGIRLNNAIFRPAPNQYTSLVDPWRVESITVIKGPGSAPFGSDALGGVIEVNTPLPVFDSPTWAAHNEALWGLASADQSSVGHVSLAVGRSGMGVAASVTIEDHQDLRSGNGTRQAPSDYQAYGAQLTGHVDRGPTSFTAWLQYYEQPELPRTDELRPGFGQQEASSEVWAYRPSRRLFAHLRELVRNPWMLDGLEVHAAYQRIDDDRRSRDTGATDELHEEISDHGFTALVRGTGHVGATTLLGGLEGLHDYVECGRTTLDLTTGTSTAAPCRFPQGSTMTQGGLFAEVRRELGSRVGVRAGARSGVSALRIAGDAESKASVTTGDWAAELGLEMRATPSLAVVANLGRGYRAPNINDLSGLGPRPGNRFQQPAESLTNEHATGVDLGIRVHTADLRAEAYVFGLQHEDRIDVVPTGMMTESGRMIVVSDNVGTTRTYGVEVAGVLEARDDLRLSGSLTWVRGTKDDTGDGDEPADRIPPLGGAFSAQWSPIKQLTLEGGARFAGAQRRLSARDREDPRIDPTGTDRFLILMIGAKYAWPWLTVSARVENLGDLQYREHASGIDAPGIDARLLAHWNRDF